MIEIEFSALARECLHRRIPSQEMLEREVLALVKVLALTTAVFWKTELSIARLSSLHY